MIEKLVTSVEVSKKLKKLGVLQKGCYYWVKIGGRYCIVTASLHEPLKNEYYAFTCTELAAMIGEIKTIFWTYPLSPDAMGKTIIDLLSIYSVNDTNTNIKKFWEKK